MDSRQGIDWGKIPREDFEEFVEALLVRWYRADPRRTAAAVDGRGGDGGIDVDVTEGDKTVHVYQLKHFPDGFSGGFRDSRRKQIQRSFDEAAGVDGLQDWTLVVPANGTPQERRWTFARRGPRPIRIHFIGRAELDEMFAQHRDLLHWATREPLLDSLRQVGQERLALAGPDDLADRARNLAELADSRSAFWGVNLTVRGNEVVHEFYAKRPDAAEREPIGLEFTTHFGDEHVDLRATYQKALDYGTTRTIQLPAEVIAKLRVTGPEWIARESSRGAVEMLPPTMPQAVPAEVRVVTPSGVTLASLTGDTKVVDSGRVGMTIEVEFRGCFTMTFTVPHKGSTGEVRMSYDVMGISGTDAHAVLRFVKELEKGNPMQLLASGHEIFRMETPTRTDGGDFEPVDPGLDAIVQDLAVLEREFGVTFAVPGEFSTKQQVDLRATRLLAEGRCIVWPLISGMNATLNGKIDDTLRGLLTAPRAYAMTAPQFESEILGQRIVLGTLRAYHPNAVVKDGPGVLEAVEAGNGEGKVIQMVPSDGSGFRVWISERWPDEHKKIVPEPLGVPGLPESSAYLKAAGEAVEEGKARSTRGLEVRSPKEEGSDQRGP